MNWTSVGSDAPLLGYDASPTTHDPSFLKKKLSIHLFLSTRCSSYRSYSLACCLRAHSRWPPRHTARPLALLGTTRPSLSRGAWAPPGRCLRWIPHIEEPPFCWAVRRCCVKAHIARVCFDCFRGMLQVFHMDVAKKDRDVAHVAIVVHVCCKHPFQMFICFFKRML